MSSELYLFLVVVKTHTEKGMSLHRAKALKWTGERVLAESHGLNKHDKEELWHKILKTKLVNLDQHNNILGLSELGETHLSQFHMENV